MDFDNDAADFDADSSYYVEWPQEHHLWAEYEQEQDAWLDQEEFEVEAEALRVLNSDPRVRQQIAWIERDTVHTLTHNGGGKWSIRLAVTGASLGRKPGMCCISGTATAGTSSGTCGIRRESRRRAPARLLWASGAPSTVSAQ